MIDIPDGWRDWRASVDKRLDNHDDHLQDHALKLNTLDTRQQIQYDNEAARHARTPQFTISLVSMGISILFFVLQLLAARGGTP